MDDNGYYEILIFNANFYLYIYILYIIVIYFNLDTNLI